MALCLAESLVETGVSTRTIDDPVRVLVAQRPLEQHRQDDIASTGYTREAAPWAFAGTSRFH